MSEIPTSVLLDKLQASVKDALVDALQTRAISLSSHEAKRTGNAYQPVKLGEETLRGFRVSDRHVFAGVDLRGKTTIDLGCNLGEIVRDAARAGAANATGVEYDDYFVQVARFAAAYNRLGNVNYFQGDLTTTEPYKGQYDIVSALSVFTYIKGHIGRIAKMTKELAIIETHSVRPNWQGIYLKPLQRHFSHVAMVGISDHKAANNRELRYVLFCAQKPLDSYILERARALSGVQTDYTVDVSKSKIAHYDAFLAKIGVERGASIDDIIAASRKTWPKLTSDEVGAAVKEKGLVYSPEYWAAFLRGYEEYKAAGEFTEGNYYYKTLVEMIDKGLYDGAFKTIVANPAVGVPRVGRRYEMFDQVASGQGVKDPIVIFNPLISDVLPENHPYQVHLNESATDVKVLALDGHHRLFAAYLAGEKKLPVLPAWTTQQPAVAKLIAKKPELEEAIWGDVYPLNQKLCE